MMRAVKKGGDRQALHERLREHSLAAAAAVKEEGMPNDLIGRIASDPVFGLSREELDEALRPEAFTGRAPEQVTEYLDGVIRPVLQKNRDLIGEKATLRV
jgi:adenylosuccinate lyase